MLIEATLHQRFSTSNATNNARRTPGFNCHTIIKNNVDGYSHVYAGSASGELFTWPLNNSRSAHFQNGRLVGKHAGAVLCVLYHPRLNLFFTGSIDRCIKVWDIFQAYTPSNRSDSCIHTLVMHKNSVTCLAWHYDTIISGSVDSTIVIWKMESDRQELGLCPWFVKLKVIGTFRGWVSSIWANPFSLTGDQPEIIVGDMEGDLTLFKTVGRIESRREIVDVYQLSKRKKFRRLGITNILRLQSHNVLITLANDNCGSFSETFG